MLKFWGCGNFMAIRRIFAGTLAALLLCVPAIATACDLSCGFSQLASDCHSAQITGHDSASPDVAMGGMSMPNMDDDRSPDRQEVSSAQQAMPIHGVLVDMGECTRHSCDQAQWIVSNTNQCAPRFRVISRTPEFPSMESLRIAFHDARDDIATLSSPADGALHTNLRI
jgi:hypothetical protein